MLNTKRLLGLAVAAATLFSIAEASAQAPAPSTTPPGPATKMAPVPPAPAAKAPAAPAAKAAAAPTCTEDMYYNKVTKACAARCQPNQGLKWGTKVNAKTKKETKGCVTICATTETWNQKSKACVAKAAPKTAAPAAAKTTAPAATAAPTTPPAKK